MSVVAAKVYDDKIVISSDSILVYGRNKELIQTNFSKLDEINNMIIGSVGTAEERSLLFRFAQSHRPEQPTEKDVLAFILEFAKWKKDYNNSEIDNTYLIAFDGHLFEVEHMCVMEIFNYASIGAGRDFASAALYLGHAPREAVKTACAMCCFVSEPIIEYEMIKEGEIIERS